MAFLLAAGAAGASPVLMFERDQDAPAPELIFRSYGGFDDMVSNTAFQDHAGAIDIASTFSTTGLTWDGSRFVVAFARDVESSHSRGTWMCRCLS